MRWGRTQTRTFRKSVIRQQQRASLKRAAINLSKQQQTRAEDTAVTWPRSQLAQHGTTSHQTPLQPTEEPFNVPLNVALDIEVQKQSQHFQPNGQLHCKTAYYQLPITEHDDTDNSIRSAALLGRQRLAQTQHGRTRRRSFHRQAEASALNPDKPQMDQSNGKSITGSGGYQTPQKRHRTERKDCPLESNR